jgi:hypothetical protein
MRAERRQHEGRTHSIGAPRWHVDRISSKRTGSRDSLDAFRSLDFAPIHAELTVSLKAVESGRSPLLATLEVLARSRPASLYCPPEADAGRTPR